MKKKEILKRLEATTESIEELKRETARSRRTTNDIIRLREEILRHEPPVKFHCPWCNDYSCGDASTLRLHEQECGSNRNKWRPTNEFLELLKELDIDTNQYEAVSWIGAAIHRVKQLKHGARPICVVCGISASTLNAMRTHMQVEHKLSTNWPAT